jgi:hypothetical protein
MHLLNKFLVTGADTLQPRPYTPHASEANAIISAKSMLANTGTAQDAVIIWKPFRVVRRKYLPLEVVSAELVQAELSEIECPPPPPPPSKKPKAPWDDSE